MIDHFVGTERRKFDQVNRMSVPPLFRDGLGQTIYVLKSPQGDPCLLLYSEQEWGRYMDMVASSFKGKDLMKAERKLSNITDMVIVDKAGRITIREDYKKFAQLDEDVMVIGANNRVELWLEENWNEYCDDEIDLGALGLNPGR